MGELLATGHFETLSSQVDEDEHSLELHLPFIHKAMAGYVAYYSYFFVLFVCLCECVVCICVCACICMRARRAALAMYIVMFKKNYSRTCVWVYVFALVCVRAWLFFLAMAGYLLFEILQFNFNFF